MSDHDEKYLRHAIGLAMRGRGTVEPNPMVGGVLGKNDRIIGEGFHAVVGGAHAEPAALNAATEDPRGATAYVTLEPCCHTNKRTPPCAPRLIEAGIARVVLGCTDPNPEVNGKGVAMLRAAGIFVERPLLELECRQLIAPFLLRVNERRPYVTLKWAETADRAVAGAGGKPIQITDERATKIVHELRSRCDAIVVGINTVLSDDPFLTARGVDNRRPLLRYVLDRQLRIPMESRLVRSAEELPVIVATRQLRSSRRAELEARGVIVIDASDFEAVLRDQADRNVMHVLVEPGPVLAKSLLATRLVDRLWVFRSASIFNEQTAACGTVCNSPVRTRSAYRPLRFSNSAGVPRSTIRPACITNTRSHRDAAARLCVTRMTVRRFF